MSRKVPVQKTERAAVPVYIDYKDVGLLRSYLTVLGRIVPRYYSGVSLKQQKALSLAIKRAREMALLPYVGKQ